LIALWQCSCTKSASKRCGTTLGVVWITSLLSTRSYLLLESATFLIVWASLGETMTTGSKTED